MDIHHTNSLIFFMYTYLHIFIIIIANPGHKTKIFKSYLKIFILIKKNMYNIMNYLWTKKPHSRDQTHHLSKVRVHCIFSSCHVIVKFAYRQDKTEAHINDNNSPTKRTTKWTHWAREKRGFSLSVCCKKVLAVPLSQMTTSHLGVTFVDT